MVWHSFTYSMLAVWGRQQSRPHRSYALPVGPSQLDPACCQREAGKRQRHCNNTHLLCGGLQRGVLLARCRRDESCAHMRRRAAWWPYCKPPKRCGPMQPLPCRPPDCVQTMHISPTQPASQPPPFTLAHCRPPTWRVNDGEVGAVLIANLDHNLLHSGERGSTAARLRVVVTIVCGPASCACCCYPLQLLFFPRGCQAARLTLVAPGRPSTSALRQSLAVPPGLQCNTPACAPWPRTAAQSPAAGSHSQCTPAHVFVEVGGGIGRLLAQPTAVRQRMLTHQPGPLLRPRTCSSSSVTSTSPSSSVISVQLGCTQSLLYFMCSVMGRRVLVPPPT